jgi:hypothetical protein
VSRRGAWHYVLHVVAWAVLLFFLAMVIASSLVNVLDALK